MYTYNTQTILAKNNKLQYITLIETSFFGMFKACAMYVSSGPVNPTSSPQS